MVGRLVQTSEIISQRELDNFHVSNFLVSSQTVKLRKVTVFLRQCIAGFLCYWQIYSIFLWEVAVVTRCSENIFLIDFI